MEFRPIERSGGAFQQSLSAEQIRAVCARVFGGQARVVEAVELGGGLYNSTYRLTLEGQPEPVVLRVAPEPARQFLSERELMRNEYASVPWLTCLAPLMPKVIAADWSHEVIGRDYLVQSFLDGVPAPERLGEFPRSQWPSFFQQLGAISRDVHAVRGQRFGPVSGPNHSAWSDAVLASLEIIAADAESAGLDATDLYKVTEVSAQLSTVLDEITEPRMLAGDLWTVNVMLDPDAAVPVITGVLDLDRTWWGDPAADWTIRMAAAKPGTERDAFWDSYGPPDRTEAGLIRALIYEARHLGAIRLERHRLGNVDGVRASYDDMAAILAALS